MSSIPVSLLQNNLALSSLIDLLQQAHLVYYLGVTILTVGIVLLLVNLFITILKLTP